ncbi:MAG: PilZN3 domain-containing protein [Treponemataceae bacterium]
MTVQEEIERYYTSYFDKEIILTKEFVKTLGLVPHQVQIKCDLTQWPCIINSISLSMAKFIIDTKGGAYGMLTSDNISHVSLHLSFVRKNYEPLSFFLASKVTAIHPYEGAKDFEMVEIEFTERPNDEFISILGSTIEANQNYINRREERVCITEEVKKIIHIASEQTTAFIQHVPRHCILRDISFSGAKIFLMGIASFLVGKSIIVRFDFNDPEETFNIRGMIVSSEEILQEKGLVSASIKFDSDSVPMTYKMYISKYLHNLKKTIFKIEKNTTIQGRD